MKYMLDTNICSYIIKHRPLEVRAKFKTLQMNDCAMSCITYAELKYWVARNKRLHVKSQNQGVPRINEQVINHFISHLDVIEFDPHAADVYAEIRDEIESKGLMVGNADLLIGAHAISLDRVLVTNNTKDFVNFPAIQLENWVTI
jgi:tRNA(fMet)-specific endonuclease VapC